MNFPNCLFVVCASVLWNLTAVLGQTSASNFVLENFFWCRDVPQQFLPFFIHPRNFNPGFQLIDANVTLPVSVGNDISVSLTLDVSTEITGPNIWIPLFKTEGELCKMMDSLLGEIWYDIERSMGIIPRSCPIPRGSYHAVNHAMDFSKLKLQGLPFGKTKATVRYFKKINKEIVACHVFIVNTKSH